MKGGNHGNVSRRGRAAAVARGIVRVCSAFVLFGAVAEARAACAATISDWFWYDSVALATAASTAWRNEKFADGWGQISSSGGQNWCNANGCWDHSTYNLSRLCDASVTPNVYEYHSRQFLGRRTACPEGQVVDPVTGKCDPCLWAQGQLDSWTGSRTMSEYVDSKACKYGCQMVRTGGVGICLPSLYTDPVMWNQACQIPMVFTGAVCSSASPDYPGSGGDGPDTPPPPDSGGGDPPPPDSGGGDPPPPDSGGSNPPPPDSGGSNPPPPDSGGGDPPPPDSGGGDPPPPDSGGGDPPPPDSGGSNPPPPDSGGGAGGDPPPPDGGGDGGGGDGGGGDGGGGGGGGGGDGSGDSDELVQIPTSELWQSKEIDLGPFSLSSYLGEATQCPQPLELNIFGQPYSWSFDPLCNFALLLRNLVIAVGFAIAAMTVARYIREV